MPGGNYTPSKLKYTPIDPVHYQVAAGAAGWVDTDVSVTTGTDTGRIWAVGMNGWTGNAHGVRAHGSSVDAETSTPAGFNFVHVDDSGHVDLYRNAVDAGDYTFMGYFE